MTKKALIVIPYRDSYFIKKYGFAVRDTQLIYKLQQKNIFSEIIIINRPVSIYERLFTKKKKTLWPNAITIDTTSIDFFGPLKKRAWTVNCYQETFQNTFQNLIDLKEYEEIVILDYTPMSILPIVESAITKIFYWYDLIDNFTKHNRYDFTEKKLVQEKYNYVCDHYNAVTGVSSKALEAVGHKNSYLLTNGVFDLGSNSSPGSPEYDLGFVGFVTDKFDTAFVKKLADWGYSVIIHGKVMDKTIQRELEASGIVCSGAFSYIDIQKVISTFKVGLLPYRYEKSHDESPLKLYEYLKYNKPCLTSMNFEISNLFVLNYNETNICRDRISKLLLVSGSTEIAESISPSDYLENKIDAILPYILNH
jgi:teichuronic acid biosynthesis glycosyltransferase TuaH